MQQLEVVLVLTCLFSIVVTELEVLILNCLSCFSWGPTLLQMEDIGDDCLDLPLLLGGDCCS